MFQSLRVRIFVPVLLVLTAVLYLRYYHGHLCCALCHSHDMKGNCHYWCCCVMALLSWCIDRGYINQLNVKIIPVSNNLLQPFSYLSPEVRHLLLRILHFPHPSLCAQIPDSGLNEWRKKWIWFFRQGQTALRTGLCTAHSQKQSHLLVQPVPSPFSHTPPLFSLYSPYCPLACLPQCYKLRTTQTSRPNAPPWMPSKLHFFREPKGCLHW